MIEVVDRVLALTGRGHPVRVGVDGRSAAGKTTFADGLARALGGRAEADGLARALGGRAEADGLARALGGRAEADGPERALGGQEAIRAEAGGPARALGGREVIRAELDHFMRMVEDRDAYPYDSPESYYLDSWDYPAIRRLLLEPLGPGGDRRYRAGSTMPDAVAGEDAVLIADGVFLQRPEMDAYWDLRVYLEVSLDESLRRGVERDQHWMGSAAEAEARYRGKYLPGEERYLAEVRPWERAQIVIDNSDPARPRLIRS